MSHDRDEGGARALPPRSAQIAQKWSELRDLAEFAPLLRKSYSRAAKNGVRHFQDRRLSSNLGDLSQLVQERALDDRAESSHLLVRGGPQRRRVREKGGGREPLEGGSVPVNEIGADSDESRGVGPAAPPTGCRASRRGAPGPQGALRPLGFCLGTAVRRFCLALAARPGNASSGSPSPLALLAPPVSRERLHSIACSWPRSFRRVARLGLSLRASNAPSGSPSEALRSPSRWVGKICIAAYKPSFLRFARRNDLAPRTAQGEGEPLATARSRRVMGRSLRFAPITKRPRPRMGGRGLEVSVCRGNLASTCPS